MLRMHNLMRLNSLRLLMRLRVNVEEDIELPEAEQPVPDSSRGEANEASSTQDDAHQNATGTTPESLVNDPNLNAQCRAGSTSKLTDDEGFLGQPDAIRSRSRFSTMRRKRPLLDQIFKSLLTLK